MPVRFHAIVPAAGAGTRLGADMPKQYLPLAGEAMIIHSVRALLQADWIEQVLVVVAPEDQRARPLFAAWTRVRVCACGGATRRDSVLAGIAELRQADPDDWVLVHDAARPGLRSESLQALRTEVARSGSVGALLATPIVDTVKRGDGMHPPRIASTIPREHLWLAQTPQIFRLGPLRRALCEHSEVTDEAGAVEASGLAPALVPGRRDNFKVTTSDDLMLMDRILSGPPHCIDGDDRP